MAYEQERDFCNAAAVLINRMGFVPLAGSPVPVGQAMTDHGMFHVYFPKLSYDYPFRANIYGRFTDSSVFDKMTVFETRDLIDFRDGSMWHLSSLNCDNVLRAFENYMAEVNVRPPTAEEIAADTWKPEKPENIVVKKLKSIGWWMVGIIGSIAIGFVLIIVLKILGALVS